MRASTYSIDYEMDDSYIERSRGTESYWEVIMIRLGQTKVAKRIAL